MPEDLTVDRRKFDALLRTLIESRPITQQEAKEDPKLRKDGQPKKKRIVHSPDKERER
jgi:hypothetical protein